jgi:hypothetical protein
MTSVQANLDGVAGDARLLLANLNRLTGAPNQEHVADILVNADRMVADITEDRSHQRSDNGAYRQCQRCDDENRTGR